MSPNTILEQLKKYGEIIADIRIFFFTALWLMVLTVAGTLAQRYVGLYQAQMNYFSSFIMWAGPIPLPGGYFTMTVMFFNLLATVIFKLPRWRIHLGVIITHIGALLLLIGGVLTAVYSVEGNMVIDEGKSADFFSDYHRVELVFTDTSPKDFDQEIIFSQGWLEPGKKIQNSSLPFQVEILNFYQNCTARQLSTPATGDLRGMARFFSISELPPAKEDNTNRSCVEYRVSGAGPQMDGRYISVEFVDQPQLISVNNVAYVPTIRSARHHVPFEIQLIDFQKKNYAGTQMASGYKSVVNIIDGQLRQRVEISMNQPLRYKGYTFYQSSFREGGIQETTVLSVVKNVGRHFPYISSIIMTIGLLIHLLMHLPKLFRDEGENKNDSP